VVGKEAWKKRQRHEDAPEAVHDTCGAPDIAQAGGDNWRGDNWRWDNWRCARTLHAQRAHFACTLR
jgi:hypothetical protein